MIRELVSVIIPCYNQEQFIEEALDSVLKQTYGNWECIVVDDGSTDRSAEIIHTFCVKDSRFSLLKQTNQGVAAARNNGFIITKGQFIQFLDGDDFLLPDKLEKQVDLLISDQETDIVYCNYKHFYQNRNKTEQYGFMDVSADPLHMFLFYWDRGVSIPPHAPLFRRSIWANGELPFPDDYNGRYEDWVFWIGLCLKKVTFKMMVEPLVVYRIHENNFCGNSFNSAHYMLCAANYISSIIPEELRTDFILKTHQHVMSRYVESNRLQDEIQHFIIRLDRRKFGFLKKLVSPLLFLKKTGIGKAKN